jgi:hypothetical protein
VVCAWRVRETNTIIRTLWPSRDVRRYQDDTRTIPGLYCTVFLINRIVLLQATNSVRQCERTNVQVYTSVCHRFDVETNRWNCGDDFAQFEPVPTIHVCKCGMIRVD